MTDMFDRGVRMTQKGPDPPTGKPCQSKVGIDLQRPIYERCSGIKVANNAS